MGRFYEWEPFAEGKGKQLGFALLCRLCFGKADVIFTQWKPLGSFDPQLMLPIFTAEHVSVQMKVGSCLTPSWI